ncbi:hypothetical protein EJ02DRAFT_458614 [Clathrospora elynae]|uniref:Uncharacterized protein n=1 Tax=Clathrospora elynae TaxID=706981 RepID=A0A6A5SD88_9PLEO|nr:hypothetical protein EJ02DRAFT_458614 [Clathrospora elynae]
MCLRSGAAIAQPHGRRSLTSSEHDNRNAGGIDDANLVDPRDAEGAQQFYQPNGALRASNASITPPPRFQAINLPPRSGSHPHETSPGMIHHRRKSLRLCDCPQPSTPSKDEKGNQSGSVKVTPSKDERPCERGSPCFLPCETCVKQALREGTSRNCYNVLNPGKVKCCFDCHTHVCKEINKAHFQEFCKLMSCPFKDTDAKQKDLTKRIVAGLPAQRIDRPCKNSPLFVLRNLAVSPPAQHQRYSPVNFRTSLSGSSGSLGQAAGTARRDSNCAYLYDRRGSSDTAYRSYSNTGGLQVPAPRGYVNQDRPNQIHCSRTQEQLALGLGSSDNSNYKNIACRARRREEKRRQDGSRGGW